MSNRKRVKVLHIITNLPIGGAQDNTLLTVERLDRDKYDVTLLSAPEGEWLERAQRIPNLHLIFVKELKRRIHPLKDVIAFFKILNILRKGKYEIVHTHSSKPGFHGRLAAKLLGVPAVIHTIHGFPFNDFMGPLKRGIFINIERFLSRITDRIVTVSTLNLDKAVRLKLAAREKFVNIYSGIDFDKFNVAVNVNTKKQELGILNGEKIVGMVGRFSPQKSPQDFVRAIPQVLKKQKNVRFLFIGDGDLHQQIVALSKELGVEDKIKILGFRDDIPELLNVLDVYVLSSLWEGLGRSLTEAMYTGRPVVATRVDGVPELVKDGETGMLAQPGDPESLARGIIALLSDEDKARAIGAAARHRITESFQADQMVRAIEDVYDALLHEKKALV